MLSSEQLRNGKLLQEQKKKGLSLRTIRKEFSMELLRQFSRRSYLVPWTDSPKNSSGLSKSARFKLWSDLPTILGEREKLSNQEGDKQKTFLEQEKMFFTRN